LSDAQWTEIAKYSGLPLDAKPRIAQAIEVYQSTQASYDNRNKPEHVRREFDRLTKIATTLARDLATALNDIDFWSAFERSRLPYQQTLSQLQELQRLIDQLTRARRQIVKEKTGARRKSGPASSLVFLLDEILGEFTDRCRSLDRSKKSKRFATAVLRIADPQIGPGTIDEAIKQRMEIRKLVKFNSTQKQ
jgi:hypothetical protein